LKENPPPAAFDQFKNDLEVLSTLQHPNVASLKVRFRGVFRGFCKWLDYIFRPTDFPSRDVPSPIIRKLHFSSLTHA